MEGKTILIVEDDPVMLRGLKDNFQFKGYEVHTAADGDEGLNLALKIRPDLILLDIMLPKVNGYEICAHVREAGHDMPIIMLTAKGQEEDIVRGLNLGADDYVTKPFGIRELLARVQAFLRRRHTHTEPLIFGACTLDFRAHKLYQNEQEIELTPKEFGLLELFVNRPNRALTRETIMNMVWGSSSFVSTRSIDRCVSTLRNKIEPDPHRPRYIHTVRDFGYRFDLPIE